MAKPNYGYQKRQKEMKKKKKKEEKLQRKLEKKQAADDAADENPTTDSGETVPEAPEHRETDS